MWLVNYISARSKTWLKKARVLRKLPFVGSALLYVWYVVMFPLKLRRILTVVERIEYQKGHRLSPLSGVQGGNASQQSPFIASITQLLTLASKVPFYQPLYHFPFGLGEQPQRICRDRADKIYQDLSPLGPCRILDVGSSLGYFSYYFAERGYHVLGVESVQENITICQMLGQFNDAQPSFDLGLFNKDYLASIPKNTYNVAFLFSVLHHITYNNSLTYVQELIRDLLDKIPILYIELALAHEETDQVWRPSLPEQELDILAKCKDFNVEKIGEFANHLSQINRPLYKITKNRVRVGEQSYPIKCYQFQAHKGSGYRDRVYYESDHTFIKKYFYNRDNDPYGNREQLLSEIKTYRTLPSNPYFPKIVAVDEQENEMTLILTKVPGQNVVTLLQQGTPINKKHIIFTWLNALKLLRKFHLFHNDIRLWNTLWDGTQASIVDLGLASPVEQENTNLALLWMIKLLYSPTATQLPYPLTIVPEISLADLDQELQEVTQGLLTNKTFDAFLKVTPSFKENGATSLEIA